MSKTIEFKSAVCKGSFFLGTDCGTCERCIIEKKAIVQTLTQLYLKEKALDNIYMLAKRENRKAGDLNKTEVWQHILRLCTEAGCTSSILR